MPTYMDPICNGLWEYRPDFSKASWRKGATAAENVAAGPDGLAAEEGKKGAIIWTMRSPYPFVGGRIEAEGTDAKFSISVDGKTWEGVKDNNLDKFFETVGPARYEYRLKCQLEGPARLRRLAITSTTCKWPLLPCRRWPWARTPSPTPISPATAARCGSRTSGWSGRPPGRRRRRRRRLSGRRRRVRRHRRRLPVDPRQGSRWRRDRATTSSSCPAAPTCGFRCR